MNLLEWAAKEIKAILPRIEEEASPPNTWGEKSLEHGGEGNLECSISVTNLALNKPYIVLNFLKTGNEKRKLILRIPLLVGGSEERLLTEDGKDMTRLLRKVQVEKQRESENQKKNKKQEKKPPFIFNPLYIHPELSSKDIEAQIALRLLQVDEPHFYGLLEEYFKKNFQGSRKIDDMSAFIVYLRDHWHLPEDWKAWRSYVVKTIKKFYTKGKGREISVGNEIEKVSGDYTEEIEDAEEVGKKRKAYGYFGTWKDEETGKYFYTVERTSELTGISEVTLYRWVKNGKVTSKREKGFIFLDKEEVEKVRDQKDKRKGLAGLVAERKRIKPESARRWIKRMENRGLNQKEILKRGKESLEEG